MQGSGRQAGTETKLNLDVHERNEIYSVQGEVKW
jgi:hypothetical protein